MVRLPRYGLIHSNMRTVSMDKIPLHVMFNHSHYIPQTLCHCKELFSEWVIVPEVYPDLLYSYYGILDYCTSIKEFVQFFSRTDMNKMPHFFSIENIRLISDVNELSSLKNLGICAIQLYHHSDSEFFNRITGITEKGMRLLSVMLDNNIALDLSHLNDDWCLKILRIFSGKIQMSHCAVSELLDAPYRRSNAISIRTMEKLVAHDSLIGICFVNDIVGKNENELDEEKLYIDIVQQFEFIGRRLGCNNFCLGPDFLDFQYYSKIFSKKLLIPECFFTASGYVKLFCDLSTAFGQVAAFNILWSNAHQWYTEIHNSR